MTLFFAYEAKKKEDFRGKSSMKWGYSITLELPYS